MKLLAKPNETLIEHSQNCIDVWQKLKEVYQPIITDESFWKDSYTCVLFHDIGKIIDSFQKMIVAIQQHKMPNFDKNFRHELFSGFVVSGIFGNKNILPTLAVFTHHKKLNGEIFIIDKNRRVDYNVKDIVNFVQYFEFNNGQDFSKIPDNWNQGEQFYSVFHNTFLLLKNIDSNDRIKYIFHKGILNTCDWFASGHRQLFDDIIIEKNNFQRKLEDKINSKISFTKFQMESHHSKNHCLAISPTGSGKTEAALLWAGKKTGKIIYLLPTKVTSNALYERMIQYFGNENVGLVHSSALVDRENDYDMKEYFIEKNFYKPITVATIDQILTIGFNIGHWEVKSFNLIGAKVIIDEIHAYDFYTLGLTVATIRYFSNLGAKFFLMSATIPDYLKTLFLNEIKNVKLIQNNKLQKQSKNRFLIYDDDIDSLDTSIIDSVNNNKKVLIVVNTVREAIKLYEKYKKFNPICYHSRFINKHRKQKEEQIICVSNSKNGCLVITTQVVEVSLDIDFDILFTENAPADAIIQRAGRINRKNVKNNTDVIIFQHFEISEKIYNPTVLSKTFKTFQNYHNQRISESIFTEIVNIVYSNIELQNNQQYNEGLERFNEIQKHYNYIEDANTSEGDIFTRVIDYIKIPAIPSNYLEETDNLKPIEKAKYQVNLPYWVKTILNIYTKDNFEYIDIDYNFERGAVLCAPIQKSFEMY